MNLEECNPYVRAAEVQPAIMEGIGPRKTYDYRLFYILEGTGTIFWEGQAYPARPDTLAVFPPCTQYYFQGKLKTVVLNFDLTRRYSHRTKPICPPPVANFDSRLLFETETAEGFHQPYLRCGDLTLRNAALQIVGEFRLDNCYADAKVSALLKLLLSELLQRDQGSEKRICQQVLGYIRIHAASITGNKEIAEAFGYHPVYLGELFKRETGQTLHSAITEERILLACRWLTGTDVPVEEIAYACGFHSRTHFCAIFKKRMGIAPALYRKAQHEKIHRNAPDTET